MSVCIKFGASKVVILTLLFSSEHWKQLCNTVMTKSRVVSALGLIEAGKLIYQPW